MTPTRLSNQFLEASILPEIGGSIARLDWIEGGGRIAVMRPYKGNARNPAPSQLACFPLIPWCNRIGLGRFAFDGKTHRLTPNYPGEPYPLHGGGWLSAWNITASTPDTIVLALERIDEPFAYAGALRYALEANALVIRLAAQNRGAARLPFGVGLHPWFVRTPAVTLRAAAGGIWHASDDLLPVSHGAVPEDANFAQWQGLPQRLIDNSFSGWRGNAAIRWPELGIELDISTAPALEYFQLFAPIGKAFFCFEPVTHPANAFNLPPPFEHAGLKVLEPGEEIELEVRFTCARSLNGMRER